jgi:hypothetical protein
MKTEKKRKIKSQKIAAIFLIFGSLIILISTLRKENFAENGINDYVICVCLLVIIVCGGIGLKNSLKKEKELK